MSIEILAGVETHPRITRFIRDDKTNLDKLLGHCLCSKLNETRML